MAPETELEYLIVIDKIFKSNDRGRSQSRQCGNDRIEETIDVKIIVEMIAEIEEGKITEGIMIEAEAQHQEVAEDIIAQVQV